MSVRVLVTGSSGLVGSAVCRWFGRRGVRVHGVDNNQRAAFFGPAADTRATRAWLEREEPNFRHHELDIRDRAGMAELIREVRPEAIVHAAAQPSHDRAAEIPFEDFETNAGGTLNLLEAARRFTPEAPFVFLSTNKVYGDGPNGIALREEATRWEFDDPGFADGIAEDFRIDQSRHSLFGVSKAAADLMVQEYGRTFGMPTVCLRAGCLTGPAHRGVELHGFLSYLVRCNVEGHAYRVFGYQGKQVRDNLHAEDLAAFIGAFVDHPRIAEVYNIGGGKENTCSVLEAFALAERFSGKPQRFTLLDEPRGGDHLCYYSDLRKARRHYPDWQIRYPLQDTIRQLVEAVRSN